jgi:drug/metabolite transporter (DMT)-like permease
MAGAGLAWAVYSLRGGGSGSALQRTGGNFWRATVLSLPLAAAALVTGHATPFGVAFAVLSGAVTSGLGYAIWYRALPGLTTIQAASVQLTVPLIAALGAILALGESMPIRLVVCGLCLLFGVALTIPAQRTR